MSKKIPTEIATIRSSHNVIMTTIEYGFIIGVTLLAIAAATFFLIEQLSLLK